MPLLVYNLTTAPLTLANPLKTVIPPSTAGLGARGEPWYSSGAELQGLAVSDYTNLQAQVDAGLVSYEWSASPEYNIFPLVAGSAAGVLVENALVYVAPGGSDSNLGTQSSPLATFDAAWNLVTSQRWAQQGKIFLAPGVAGAPNVYPINPNGSYVNAAGSRGLGGTPLAVVGGFTNELGTLTNDTLDPNGVTFSQATLVGVTPNQYLGAFILCTSGPNAGSQAMIASNTATTFSLQLPFGNPIAVGDQFEIQLPAVQLEIPTMGNEFPVFGYNNGVIGFVGIDFTTTDASGSATFVFASGTFAIMSGCQFNMLTGNVIVNQNATLRGVDAGPWGADGVNNPFNGNSSAGVFFNSVFLNIGSLSVINGVFIFNESVVIPLFGQAVSQWVGNLNTPVSTNTGFAVTPNSSLVIIDDSGGVTPPSLTGVDPYGFLASPLVYNDGSYGDIRGAHIINSPGPCIDVEINSHTRLRGITGGATLGTGAAATLVPGAAPGNTRVAGLSGVPATAVGSFISLTGSGLGNDGIYQIAAVVDPTQVDVVQNGGLPTAPDPGPLAWIINENGDVGIQVSSSSAAVKGGGVSVTGLAGDTRIAGTVTPYGGLPFVAPGTLGGILLD